MAHWRQGPLAGEDVTSTFALQSPVELPALVQQVGSAHLSLVLVTVDAHDREIGRARLAKDLDQPATAPP